MVSSNRSNAAGPNGWLQRLPEAVRETLTLDQQSAIAMAVGAEGPARRHPVNLRLSIPVPGLPVFFTMIGGRERRSRDRLQVERARHPLHTFGNILFVLFGLAGFYSISLAAMLLSTALFEM